MGAKLGRTKGNKQKAKYLKPEKKHGKPGGREGERSGKPEGRTEAPKKPLRGRNGKIKGTEEAES